MAITYSDFYLKEGHGLSTIMNFTAHQMTFRLLQANVAESSVNLNKNEKDLETSLQMEWRQPPRDGLEGPFRNKLIWIERKRIQPERKIDNEVLGIKDRIKELILLR